MMLVIDVSQSMRATDVEPNRMVAAQEAAKTFADELTPGINLGLISYAGTATVLVSPTTNRAATKAALDKLQFADRTATGEGIFTALQAIATVGAVIGGGDTRRRRGSCCSPTARKPCRPTPTTPRARSPRRAPPRTRGADLDDFVRHTVRFRRDQRPAPAGASRRHHDEKGRRALGRQRLQRVQLAGTQAGLLDAAAADRLRDDQGRRQRRLAAAGFADPGGGGTGCAADQPPPADVMLLCRAARRRRVGRFRGRADKALSCRGD
ncbi:von Willebrand factor type A domain protein [Mycobacterium xenopi 4042]|uniref:von Willebrand factor type A domain protein n=1 Tax=Mycobacterium xenopi 4042 TaxID=1299334 RepID=X7YNX6_MYCXE|nr:von Willebrand factor type A domain protein [Mycobacterium xenopi 4042]